MTNESEPYKVIFASEFWESLDKLDLDEEAKILVLNQIDELFVGKSVEEIKEMSEFIEPDIED